MTFRPRHPVSCCPRTCPRCIKVKNLGGRPRKDGSPRLMYLIATGQVDHPDYFIETPEEWDARMTKRPAQKSEVAA